MRLDGSRALAWRLRRHALDPAAGTTVADVADRVVALRAWPAETADLAVRVRQADPVEGGLARALAAGEVIRSYAFRGGSYVFTPATAAVLLACRTTTRVWESARYQRQGGFLVDDWGRLRAAVRDVLADGPATRGEIAAHLARTPGLAGLADAAATGAGADSLYKPLHWWGDICFGPDRDGRSTFRLLAGDPRLPDPPDLDDAGRRAITAYLAGYAPVTPDNLRYWLTEGLSVPRRRVAAWLADLDGVTVVEAAGVGAYVPTRDLEDLRSAAPTDAVHLLPGFDPWVFGPGTADPRVVAPQRRSAATGGAALVLRGGVVSGVWRVRAGEVAVTWFTGAGTPPTDALERAVQRLATIRGEPLSMTLTSG